jgi:hypothetical protein
MARRPDPAHVHLLRGPYLIRRLKRDAPEVAAQLARGEDLEGFRVGQDSYMNPVRLSHLFVFRLGRPAMMLLTLCRMVWK